MGGGGAAAADQHMKWDGGVRGWGRVGGWGRVVQELTNTFLLVSLFVAPVFSQHALLLFFTNLDEWTVFLKVSFFKLLSARSCCPILLLPANHQQAAAEEEENTASQLLSQLNPGNQPSVTSQGA